MAHTIAWLPLHGKTGGGAVRREKSALPRKGRVLLRESDCAL